MSIPDMAQLVEQIMQGHLKRLEELGVKLEKKRLFFSRKPEKLWK